MSGERCHELDTEELDLSDSTLEDEIPDFSSITRNSFQPARKLNRSPSLSSSSDASMDKEKQGQSSRTGNTSWCQCGKCYAMETEGERLCCQVTNETPDNYFRGTYFSIAFLMQLQDFMIKLIYTVLFLILFSRHKCITETCALVCYIRYSEKVSIKR